MPNGRTHGVIGAVVGGTAGAVAGKDQPDYARLVLVLAGTIGGAAGGLIPDKLEPAEHPHHRDFCHSLGFGTVAGCASAATLPSLRQMLFAEASRQRNMRLQLAPSDPNRFWLGVGELAVYVLYGALLGIVVGYLSHLAADALTPRSIPVISRRLG
jgi:membrane-bound metal-dependent hydrolase YbcI (DUF457 family)